MLISVIRARQAAGTAKRFPVPETGPLACRGAAGAERPGSETERGRGTRSVDKLDLIQCTVCDLQGSGAARIAVFRARDSGIRLGTWPRPRNFRHDQEGHRLTRGVVLIKSHAGVDDEELLLKRGSWIEVAPRVGHAVNAAVEGRLS